MILDIIGDDRISFTDIQKGYQYAFRAAWDAYKMGSIPVGAAILNESEEIISTGRNSVFAINDNEIINNHQLAHAESNAILQVSENNHPDIRKYTLYSTMEPCPYCFGAIVMGRIRCLKYAARDAYAGATCLNDKMPYIVNEQLKIEGPDELLEIIQISMIVCRRLDKGLRGNDYFMNLYQKYCIAGYKLGKMLHNKKSLIKFTNDDIDISEIFDYVCNYL